MKVLTTDRTLFYDRSWLISILIFIVQGLFTRKATPLYFLPQGSCYGLLSQRSLARMRESRDAGRKQTASQRGFTYTSFYNRPRGILR